MAVQFSNLAAETVVNILEWLAEDLDYIGSLVNFAATCRVNHTIAERVLYKRIMINSAHEESKERLIRLISRISSEPRLKLYVQEIYFYSECMIPGNALADFNWMDSYSYFELPSPAIEPSTQLEIIAPCPRHPQTLEQVRTPVPVDELFKLLPELKGLRKFSWGIVTSHRLHNLEISAYHFQVLRALSPKCKIEIELTSGYLSLLKHISFVDSIRLACHHSSGLSDALDLIKLFPDLKSLYIFMLKEHDQDHYSGGLKNNRTGARVTNLEISKLQSILRGVEFGCYYVEKYDVSPAPTLVKAMQNSSLKHLILDSPTMLEYFDATSMGKLTSIEIWPEWPMGLVSVDSEPVRSFLLSSPSITSLKLHNVSGLENHYDEIFERIGSRLRELEIHNEEHADGILHRYVLPVAMIKAIGGYCPRVLHFGMDINRKDEWPLFVLDAIAESFQSVQSLCFNFELGISLDCAPTQPAVTTTSARLLWGYIYAKMLHFRALGARKGAHITIPLQTMDLSSGVYYNAPSRRQHFHTLDKWNIKERQRFRILKTGLHDENGIYGCTVRCFEVEAARRSALCHDWQTLSKLDDAIERAKSGARPSTLCTNHGDCVVICKDRKAGRYRKRTDFPAGMNLHY